MAAVVDLPRFRTAGGWSFPREIGRYGDDDGPTLVVTGGIHGNEPAGALAAARVLAELCERRTPLRGRMIAIAGNRGALAVGRRYLERDLNRRWVEGSERDPVLTAEDHEQRELLAAFRALEQDRRGPFVFLDLHTTSGDAPVFSCFADTRRNRELAMALPVTAILGLDEVIDGAMLGMLADRGHIAVAVEGGQHDAPATVERLTSAIWLVLDALGQVNVADVPDLELHRQRLVASRGSLPDVAEIRHRHVVEDGDGFEMLPGFRSFDPVVRGQIVARDRNGPITIPERGLLLMPRYQTQGEDGFFVARRVRPFWLRVSTFCRRAHLDRWIARMPGVRASASVAGELEIDLRIARAAALGLLHLCGYRKRRQSGTTLVVVRRREDA
jgi:succinylglutamate desuccinylase